MEAQTRQFDNRLLRCALKLMCTQELPRQRREFNYTKKKHRNNLSTLHFWSHSLGCPVIYVDYSAACSHKPPRWINCAVNLWNIQKIKLRILCLLVRARRVVIDSNKCLSRVLGLFDGSGWKRVVCVGECVPIMWMLHFMLALPWSDAM